MIQKAPRKGGLDGTRTRARGFTLVEMMITVAIIAILAATAISTFVRSRPRARFQGTTAAIQAAISSARQQAIGNARDVAVLLYPKTVTGNGTGRVVVFYDGDGGFMAGTAPAGDKDFCTFDPMKTFAGTAGSKNRIVDTIDLPNTVVVSVPTTLVTRIYPFSAAAAPANGCSFCDNALTKGGIRFDSKGTATFFKTCGTATPSQFGESFSIASTEVEGSAIIVVTPVGIVRSFHAG